MSPSVARKGRILVIEDDAHVAEMIAKIVERHGYDAVTASDGVEAIPKVLSSPTRMIILDIMMPFFSGYWYCDVFKKNPATREIPVVIISALDKKVDIEKGLKLEDWKLTLADVVVGCLLTVVVVNALLRFNADELRALRLFAPRKEVQA